MRRRQQSPSAGSEVAGRVSELREVADRLDVLETEATSDGRGPWWWARECRQAADDLARSDDLVTTLMARRVQQRAERLLPDDEEEAV